MEQNQRKPEKNPTEFQRQNHPSTDEANPLQYEKKKQPPTKR